MADANPQWLKQTLCEDLAEMDRQAGRVPDTRLIEKVINEDIREWAAMRREAKPAPPQKAPQRDSGRTTEVAQRVADRCESKSQHTKNMRTACGGLVPDEIETPKCPCGGVCKHCKMRERILMCLESLPLKERDPRHRAEMWKNCKHPALAKEVIRTWQASQRYPGVAPRRQRFMSDKDLNDWTLRQLEDICDRSNAVPGFGPWWVK